MISEKLSALIVRKSPDTSEVIPSQHDCKIPSLPNWIGGTYPGDLISMINDGKILACVVGSICLALQDGKWNYHSEFDFYYDDDTLVSMPNGNYLFHMEWKWLPTGSTTWQKGEMIPGGAEASCGVQISDNELLLIGGFRENGRRILKFNTQTNKFETLTQKLQQGRIGAACIKYEDYVIVAGGVAIINELDTRQNLLLLSTELINLQTLTSVTNADMDMKEGRCGPSLVPVHYNNQKTVLAIGGLGKNPTYRDYKDSIEIWHPANRTWTLASDLKLSAPAYYANTIQISTHLVCSP